MGDMGDMGSLLHEKAPPVPSIADQFFIDAMMRTDGLLTKWFPNEMHRDKKGPTVNLVSPHATFVQPESHFINYVIVALVVIIIALLVLYHYHRSLYMHRGR